MNYTLTRRIKAYIIIVIIGLAVSGITAFPIEIELSFIRGMPVFWRLIDCSFGVAGSIPLYLSYISIKKLNNK